MQVHERGEQDSLEPHTESKNQETVSGYHGASENLPSSAETAADT